jgi:mutator protein MutT
MKTKQEVRDVVIGICSNKDGKYLVAKRLSEDNFGDLWEFPGGKVEEGESQRTALKREWQEELGVDINITRKLATLYGLKGSQTSRAINMHLYAVRILSGNKPLPLASQEIKWIDENEIKSLTRTSQMDLMVKIHGMFRTKG